MTPLTADQARVADRVLAEEDERRTHLVVSLGGAHAYGFPSPDSDLDLKAIHLDPTHRLVGLTAPLPHATRLEVVEGVEIDYSSNELGSVLAAILQGNGGFVERVLGPWVLRGSPELDELRPLVERSLSKRLHRYYQGFARGQLQELDAAGEPTVKRLLYVLRSALTGAQLLRSGQVVTDLTLLGGALGFGELEQLMAIKRRRERALLDARTRERWRPEVERAFALLNEALARSPLPEQAPNREEAEAWLLELRRRRW